ncbi:MAG: phosphocholine cytidylyltransferase family protein [Nanoarchaeota archaeon]
MKAIICAAGQGKRLRPLTDDRPKPLIKVGEKTILEYMLDNISECGIKEAVLILGYESQKVIEKIGAEHNGCRIKYYTNPEYSTTDNMFSLWQARKDIDQGIIFFNADIIFHKGILETLVDSSFLNAVAVDDRIALIDDSMKVSVVYGKITAISKKLKNANGWAVGIYKFSPEGAKQYYEEVRKLVESGASDASFVKPVELVSQYSPVYSVSTNGLPWFEIDDFNDLETARRDIPKIFEK